jgi:hypothetical protein
MVKKEVTQIEDKGGEVSRRGFFVSTMPMIRQKWQELP